MIYLLVKVNTMVNQTDLSLLIQLLRFFNLRDYKWSIGPILKISGSHKYYQNKVTWDGSHYSMLLFPYQFANLSSIAFDIIENMWKYLRPNWPITLYLLCLTQKLAATCCFKQKHQLAERQWKIFKALNSYNTCQLKSK